MVNLALQPSQYLGRSGGSKPYCRKRASRHSCDPISVPFTVDGCTASQDPVFVAHRSRRASWTGSLTMVSARAYSARCALRLQTAVRPYWRQAKWSAVWNYTCPLSTVTRCPVMTQDAIQFSGAVSVGYGRASPACFTDRQVTLRSGAPSPSPSKISDKKVSRIKFSTGPKALPMPGVTRCTYAHSCWSEFCSPE